jgi:eukaryotic-like serine/threonine-protein kinase
LGTEEWVLFTSEYETKLLKRGMDTDFMLSRFRQERQILANLEHPFIARLIDGGATEDGLPYFVMECEDGVPNLLDFGIAKLLDQVMTSEVTLTQREFRMLTPDYASPEQIMGLPIGTSSDIYFLG